MGATGFGCGTDRGASTGSAESNSRGCAAVGVVGPATAQPTAVTGPAIATPLTKITAIRNLARRLENPRHAAVGLRLAWV